MKDSSNITDKISFKLVRPIEELFSIDVNMVIRLFDKDGNLKDERLMHNTTKQAGINSAADQWLAAPTLLKPGWLAIGTGSPAATLLGAEVARVAFTSKTRSAGVVTMVGDFAAGVGTSAVTEAGIFDVVTANTINMFFSSSFAAINKAAGDSLSISWAVTFS